MPRGCRARAPTRALAHALGQRFHLAAQRLTGHCVAAERERAQAERAIDVLILPQGRGRRREPVFPRAADRQIVDEVDAARGRNAVRVAEQRQRRRGRERNRITGGVRRAEAVTAEIVSDAETTVRIGVSEGDRIRHVGERVRGLHEVLLRQDAVGIDDLLRLDGLRRRWCRI